MNALDLEQFAQAKKHFVTSDTPLAMVAFVCGDGSTVARSYHSLSEVYLDKEQTGILAIFGDYTAVIQGTKLGGIFNDLSCHRLGRLQANKETVISVEVIASEEISTKPE